MVPKGPQWALRPRGPSECPGVCFCSQWHPREFPSSLPVCPQQLLLYSYCALVSLQWRPCKAPSPQGVESQEHSGNCQEGPSVPRLLQTPHSGPLVISQPVPRSAWCSPPKVPACSEECASTWPQHPTVPAGLPVDSNSQSASASSPEESLLSLHSLGLPTSGERASPVGRGGEGDGVENNIC